MLRVAGSFFAVALAASLAIGGSACITTVQVQGNGDGGASGTGGTSKGTTGSGSDAAGSSSGDDASSTTTSNGDDGSTMTSNGDDAGSTSTGGDDAGDDDDDSSTGGGSGTTYSGQATYYTANGEGACGNSISDSDNVAAMNSGQYSRSICGNCARITGPNGSVTVKIEDLCPGCNADSLDLSTSAFDQIADQSAGRVSITWYYTTCP